MKSLVRVSEILYMKSSVRVSEILYTKSLRNIVCGIFSQHVILITRVRMQYRELLLKWAVVCLELLPHVGINRSLDVMRQKWRKVKRPAAAGNRTQDTWLVQPVLCH